MSLEFISGDIKSHKIFKSVLYLKFFLGSAFVFSEAKYNLFKSCKFSEKIMVVVGLFIEKF